MCTQWSSWIKHQERNAVREFANKSAASAASLDYVKFQAVIQSAASAASPAEAALAADWITAIFSQFLAALAAVKGRKSRKSRFQLFGPRRSKLFPPEATASLLTSKFSAIFGALAAQYFENMIVSSASSRFLP